jgi:flagellin
MGLRINHNIASLIAQRNLGATDAKMAKSLERLSSGLKINGAADNPAGLVISEQMRAQIAGLNQAIDNSERGVTFAQLAEGSLVEVSSVLNQLRSLALDSANSAVNDANALSANQAEVTNALAALNRIATNSQYGTKTLFNGTAFTFQIGANASQTASLTLDDIHTSVLATGVTNSSSFGSLSDINVTDATKATDSLKIIDAAITKIATLRGTIGSFQKNTLVTNISNLKVAAENMTAAESTIRDADFASEMAQYTQSQILMQAGTAMLANANQAPSAVLSLLRG